MFQQGVNVSIGNLGQSKAVVLELDRVDDVVPEGGVAGGALVLVLAHEQALAAADAAVDASVLGPPVLAREGALGADGLGDVELVGRELGLEVLPALALVLEQPLLEGLLVLEGARLAVL